MSLLRVSLLGQQKGSLVCTCPAFRICTTPEWRNGQVTSSQTPLTLDTTCLRFSLQADATDLCALEHLGIKTFFPLCHLQPKQLTQKLLPVFCNSSPISNNLLSLVLCKYVCIIFYSAVYIEQIRHKSVHKSSVPDSETHYYYYYC